MPLPFGQLNSINPKVLACSMNLMLEPSLSPLLLTSNVAKNYRMLVLTWVFVAVPLASSTGIVIYSQGDLEFLETFLIVSIVWQTAADKWMRAGINTNILQWIGVVI